jgi:hypothetical protein
MSLADDLVERHEAWVSDSPDLEAFLRAVALIFSDVELYALDVVDDSGTITAEGWTILFDPDRCPAPALPYLAQYVGERLPVGLETRDEAGAREWIKDAPNQIRGTNLAIFRAAQRRLTGSRLVALVERDGTVDTLTVVTYNSETPDPVGTKADIRSVAPDDVVLNVMALDGQTWGLLSDTHATWQAVMDAYPTWAEVATDLVGSSTFSRFRP